MGPKPLSSHHGMFQVLSVCKRLYFSCFLAQLGVPHYPEPILHCLTSIAVGRLLRYRASIISMCLVQAVFLKEVIHIINIVMSVFFFFFSMIFYAKSQPCGVKSTNNCVLSLSGVLVIPRKIKVSVFRALPIFQKIFKKLFAESKGER